MKILGIDVNAILELWPVVLGASRLEQLQENLIAAEQGALLADTVTACNDAWARVHGVSPKYNR